MRVVPRRVELLGAASSTRTCDTRHTFQCPRSLVIKPDALVGRKEPLTYGFPSAGILRKITPPANEGLSMSDSARISIVPGDGRWTWFPHSCLSVPASPSLALPLLLHQPVPVQSEMPRITSHAHAACSSAERGRERERERERGCVCV